MLAFLTTLFRVISEWLKGRNQDKLIEAGRQEAIKEANDEVKEMVAKAEDAAVAVDPAFDQRLRSRFDAAARNG